jgi:hypothetical protein
MSQHSDWVEHVLLRKALEDAKRVKRDTDPAPPPEPDDEPIPYTLVDPPHYRSHPSGVECIQITEHMSYCVGNAIKYLWRAGLKGDAIGDLRKALWHVEREIERLEGSDADDAD